MTERPIDTKMIQGFASRFAREIDWFVEHGGTLDAYVERYGDVNDEDRFGDGGQAIFAADHQALRLRFEELSSRIVKRGSVVRITDAPITFDYVGTVNLAITSVVSQRGDPYRIVATVQGTRVQCQAQRNSSGTFVTMNERQLYDAINVGFVRVKS